MKERLDPLSDAIFSIIMTILVLRIHVPEVEIQNISSQLLLQDLVHLLPNFGVFFFSFFVLGSFWINHNIVLGVFAKNMNRVLAMINFGFLAIAGLIPFTADLLASSPTSKIAISAYSFNILFLTLFLSLIRVYIIYSPAIQNPIELQHTYTEMDKIYANARVLLNVASSVLAVGCSFIYAPLSIFFLAIPVLYGLIPGLLARSLHAIGVRDSTLKKAMHT